MSDDLRTDAAMGGDATGDATGEALARYFGGECDPTEAAAVEAWLASHPEEQQLLELLRAEEARREARLAQLAPLAVNTTVALEAVRARIRAEDDVDFARSAAGAAPALRTPALRVEPGGRTAHRPAPPAPRVVRGRTAPTTTPSRKPWRALGLAAAAAVVAFVVMPRSRDVATSQVYRTAVGATDTLSLVDGTQVVLAPGSTLTLGASYADGARELALDGAAHFTVQHDSTRPFVVHVGRVAVRDIGTAFTVKSMGEGRVAVIVTEGSVAVSPRGAASPEVELVAGDRGDVVADSLHVERGIPSEAALAWTRGELAYRDAPLAEVRADLWRWFGVMLDVPDAALASRTITARFAGDSLAHVLQVLSLALGADVSRQGDTVRLTPQGESPDGGR